VRNVNGVTERTFCGPAKATVHYGTKTLSFSGGDCMNTSKYVSLNIGTVVLGTTSKPKPDYFGLAVGQVPGSTAKPASHDGGYADAILVLESGGKTYFVPATGLQVKLTNNPSRGSFAGGGGLHPKVTSIFSC
jgi:hypothetical protein